MTRIRAIHQRRFPERTSRPFLDVCAQDDMAMRMMHCQVRLVLRHPAFMRSDEPDVEQELRCKLHVNLGAYDQAKGRRPTFIRRILERTGVSLIRTRRAAIRDHRRNECSLNETIRDAEAGFVERVQTIDEARGRLHRSIAFRDRCNLVPLTHDIRRVVKSLPAAPQRLCQLLMIGTVSDAARELGTTRQSIYRQMRVLREWFEAAGLAIYL